jgi:hypothetical protein
VVVAARNAVHFHLLFFRFRHGGIHGLPHSFVAGGLFFVVAPCGPSLGGDDPVEFLNVRANERDQFVRTEGAEIPVGHATAGRLFHGDHSSAGHESATLSVVFPQG